MIEMQSGYIELEEKSYTFTYDGELLQLVPKEQDLIREEDFLVNKNISLEILEGTTINFEKIFFLNCFLLDLLKMLLVWILLIIM